MAYSERKRVGKSQTAIAMPKNGGIIKGEEVSRAVGAKSPSYLVVNFPNGEEICMLTSGKIRVKCIKENDYGYVVGKEYDVYICKDMGGDFLGVIDDFGEEYGFPRDMFEIITKANER